jgi:hypothetical protein
VQQEINRRLAVLNFLRSQYVGSRDGISTGLLTGKEWPPAEWLNAELPKLGEPWTVRTDGPTVHFLT